MYIMCMYVVCEKPFFLSLSLLHSFRLFLAPSRSWSVLHACAPRLSRIPILYQNKISPCATSSPSCGTSRALFAQKYIDFKLATTTHYIIIHTHTNAVSVLVRARVCV